MNLRKQQVGKILMLVFFISIVIGLFIHGPIAQEQSYHNFSDEGSIWGMPNFWNVMSNLPFILIGILGLRSYKASKVGSLHVVFLYSGIALVGLGSGYYHWAPTNETLIWDRLPMTICFMTLFSVLLRDFLGVKQDKMMLFILLVVGLYSIIHWVALGDLRPYVLVQFFPMVSIPVILLTQKSTGISPKPFWVLLAWYVLAKVAETYDVQIHDALNVMSGHSLKHFFAAIGLYQFYKITKNGA